MPNILQNEIAKLEARLLHLAGCAEESIHRAVRAMVERDRDCAQQVILDDAEIDTLEVDLEEEGLKVLALHRPVAGDLRFIIAVLKINNDLERIGDMGTSIARQALVVARRADVAVPFDVLAMAQKAAAMLRQALDALVRSDVDLARRVHGADKDIDAAHEANTASIEAAIARCVSGTSCYLAYLAVSRSLERVADHAKNIADDVVYMLEGDIVRHRGPSGQYPHRGRGQAPSDVAGAGNRTGE
jgi:phosphate transport system protein